MAIKTCFFLGGATSQRSTFSTQTAIASMESNSTVTLMRGSEDLQLISPLNNLGAEAQQLLKYEEAWVGPGSFRLEKPL